jgi:hypothetical protein
MNIEMIKDHALEVIKDNGNALRCLTYSLIQDKDFYNDELLEFISENSSAFINCDLTHVSYLDADKLRGIFTNLVASRSKDLIVDVYELFKRIEPSLQTMYSERSIKVSYDTPISLIAVAAKAKNKELFNHLLDSASDEDLDDIYDAIICSVMDKVQLDFTTVSFDNNLALSQWVTEILLERNELDSFLQNEAISEALNSSPYFLFWLVEVAGSEKINDSAFSAAHYVLLKDFLAGLTYRVKKSDNVHVSRYGWNSKKNALVVNIQGQKPFELDKDPAKSLLNLVRMFKYKNNQFIKDLLSSPKAVHSYLTLIIKDLSNNSSYSAKFPKHELAAILKSIKIIENITGMDFYFAKDAGSDLSKLMQMKDTSYQAPFVNYHIESKPLENYLNFVKSENQLSFLIEEYKPSFQELMQHSNKVSVKVKKMILDKLTNK